VAIFHEPVIPIPALAPNNYVEIFHESVIPITAGAFSN
jgi:hypothetical protein